MEILRPAGGKPLQNGYIGGVTFLAAIAGHARAKMLPDKSCLSMHLSADFV
jgi:hypothetical protein